MKVCFRVLLFQLSSTFFQIEKLLLARSRSSLKRFWVWLAAEFVDFAFDVAASADRKGKRSILLNQQMKVYFRCALPLTWFT